MEPGINIATILIPSCDKIRVVFWTRLRYKSRTELITIATADRIIEYLPFFYRTSRQRKGINRITAIVQVLNKTRVGTVFS